MTSRRTTIGSMMILGAALAGLTDARIAFGRQDTPVPAGAPQATAEDTKAQADATPPAEIPKPAPPAGSDNSSPLGPLKRRHVANVNKLREMIEEKIELDAAQKENIGRLFDDFLADIRKSPPMRKLVPGLSPDIIINRPDARAVEEKTRQAQQAGDAAAADKLPEQINAPQKVFPASPGDRTPLWIEKIRVEMKPDQGEAFQKTVEQWEAVAARIPILGPYMSLRRALWNPEVGLSQQELDALDVVLDDTMWACFSKTEVVTAETYAEIVEKAQVAVNRKLTPQQQAKVEANVKIYDAAMKRVRDSALLGPETSGNKGSGPDTGECSTPADPKNPKPNDKD